MLITRFLLYRYILVSEFYCFKGHIAILFFPILSLQKAYFSRQVVGNINSFKPMLENHVFSKVFALFVVVVVFVNF